MIWPLPFSCSLPSVSLGWWTSEHKGNLWARSAPAWELVSLLLVTLMSHVTSSWVCLFAKGGFYSAKSCLGVIIETLSLLPLWIKTKWKTSIKAFKRRTQLFPFHKVLVGSYRNGSLTVPGRQPWPLAYVARYFGSISCLGSFLSNPQGITSPQCTQFNEDLWFN